MEEPKSELVVRVITVDYMGEKTFVYTVCIADNEVSSKKLAEASAEHPDANVRVAEFLVETK